MSLRGSLNPFMDSNNNGVGHGVSETYDTYIAIVEIVIDSIKMSSSNILLWIVLDDWIVVILYFDYYMFIYFVFYCVGD